MSEQLKARDLGLTERVKELEARLERMTDLVRYQRHELFQEELITESEYAELVRHEGAVSRIEGYDAMRCALRSLRDAIGSALNMNAGPGVLEAALTHADAVLAREAQ